jgi:antibiotic biosynthesis monooxygenase (ABM) superfamily enzyme
VVDRHLDNPSAPSPWLVPVATTLGAWLVAFLVVTALLTLFGDELASLPLALRALVISGFLVGLMVNLVMPVLSNAVARRLAAPSPSPAAGGAAHDNCRGESNP